MSITSYATFPVATSRPLSCISGLDPGADCGEDQWDTSPDAGFYTVCCDGDIIDITGFNSYANYTLKLENLVCCHSEWGNLRSLDFDETKGCENGTGTPLESLLSTSTEVAVSRTLDMGASSSLLNPECFWSQLAEEDMVSSATYTIITSSTTRDTESIPSSNIASTSQGLSSSNLIGSGLAEATSQTSTPESSAGSSDLGAATTTTSSTGLAPTVTLNFGLLFILFLFVLEIKV
ncbi:hypothetical protein BS50DRAFT_570764 [Corynespora cassiicola Philippines]|uniref:Uncharacterized protein n=1 Tax=Corynespora cassiicola Philippines TaxID=1448308 RepID=A0A2T2P157_CORCC|nr:hypothetical protein BS50DRAFT_570764 [Corynespora cassiicola Philippines]